VNFSFQNGALGCILYFRTTAGPPNVVGPRVVYPLAHPLDGPVDIGLTWTVSLTKHLAPSFNLLLQTILAWLRPFSRLSGYSIHLQEIFQDINPLSSNRQHYHIDVCLKDNRKDY